MCFGVQWHYKSPLNSAGPANQDYLPVTLQEEFDPNHPNREVCANFTSTDDAPTVFTEADEYFIVSLTSADSADVVPEQASAQVVIHDNDGMSTADLQGNRYHTM